jgi:PAS domain S-box-containing protein
MPIKDSKGNLLRGMLVSYPDDSEAMRKHEEMIQNEKFELQAVMDSIDREFFRVTYDVDLTMIDMNDFTLKEFGYPRDKVIGTKITDKMPPEEVAAFKKTWKEILDGKIVKGEGDRVTANGIRHIWYLYTPVKDITGKTCKVLMIGQELFDKK